MPRPSAADVVKRFEQARTARARHENDWRLSSAYCKPEDYSAWGTDGPISHIAPNTNAIKRIAFDSTGMRSLPKYAAVLEQMATPHGMRYSSLRASDQDLMRINRVKAYFEHLSDVIRRMRYQPAAKFIQSAGEVYSSIGAYGTGPCFLGKRTPNAISRTPGVFYKACPLRDIYMMVNNQGEVDTVIRRIYYNLRQFIQEFPNDPVPPSMEAMKKTPEKSENEYHEFIHIVHPRDDFDPGAIDVRRFPFTASYVHVKDQQYIGKEEGFRSLPYLTPRTTTSAGDPYGFAPALKAIPALGTASSVKKTMLRQGQKAADPALLAHDDGVLNGPVDMRPGAIYYGGVNKDGKKLVHAMEQGNFQVSEAILSDERSDIEDSFFVFIFQLLEQNKEMTATEVVERAAKETALTSPVMGRLQTEWVAPFHHRELDLADELGLIKMEVPPELIEAKGEYEIMYTSPMAKNIYAEETAGFMRSVEVSLGIVNATGDQSHLDHYNFDVAIPEISSNMAVPARWMNDETVRANIAEQRAAQQEQQMLVENAGQLAGAANAVQSLGENDG